MTAKTPWAHLPNARHIDAVLADMQARPKVWSAAWAAARSAARIAARDSARDAAWLAVQDVAFTATRDAAWDAAFTAIWDPARDVARVTARDAARAATQAAARGPVRDAIRALIAWDSSADLLDLPPDVLRTMIDLAPEPVCHQAALLLPYAIVREGV